VADIQQQRLEPHPLCLRHPLTLIAVERERAGDERIGNHAHRLRQLVGNLARVDWAAG
jgi:hypothetical protein